MSNANILLDIFEIFCGLQTYSVNNGNIILLSTWKSAFSVLQFILFTVHITIYYAYKDIVKSTVLHILQYYYLVFVDISLFIIYFLNFINYKRIKKLEIQVNNVQFELDRFYTNLNLKRCKCFWKPQVLFFAFFASILINIGLSFLVFKTLLQFLNLLWISLLFKIPYIIHSGVGIVITSWYFSLQGKYIKINNILINLKYKRAYCKNIDKLMKMHKSITCISKKINRLYGLHNLLILMNNYFETIVNLFFIIYNIIFAVPMLTFHLYPVQSLISSFFNIWFLSIQGNNLKREVSNQLITL